MSASDNLPKIRVVAAIVYNENGEFLLSSRPEGKPYAGYWEFAGGKVEAGETELAALQREMMEELGIRIRRARPWLTRIHRYEHAEVHLRFWRVAAADWDGEPSAREGQQFSWQHINSIPNLPMLPANAPIFRALAVPNAFSGSLKNGLKAADDFFVAPYDLAEPHHRNILITLEQLQTRGSLPDADSVWIQLDDAAQLPYAADADVWVFRATDEHAARQTAAVLADGVAVPFIVAANGNLCREFAEQWLAAGAHAVLCEDDETFLC